MLCHRQSWHIVFPLVSSWAHPHWFWGPVHALIPTHCKEALHWDQKLAEEQLDCKTVGKEGVGAGFSWAAVRTLLLDGLSWNPFRSFECIV